MAEKELRKAGTSELVDYPGGRDINESTWGP